MSKSSVESAIALPIIVVMVFSALKLDGFIDWSWWIISSPIWGPVVFILSGRAFEFAASKVKGGRA